MLVQRIISHETAANRYFRYLHTDKNLPGEGGGKEKSGTQTKAPRCQAANGPPWTKEVTKLSEKRKERKKKKEKRKEKKTETFPDRTELNKREERRGNKLAGRRKRGNETGWKAEMKWGEAWLVRGVPPRHSLLINQPPTTTPHR